MGAIVGLIVLAVGLERGYDLRLELFDGSAFSPGHEHGPNFGADKVIGAAGAEEGQLAGVGRIDEAEYVFGIRIAGDGAAFGAETAAQIRKDRGRDLTPV